MDTLTYVLIAFLIFIVLRGVFADRTPIPETSGKVFKITKPAELDALLSSTTHVVVDFYADWCPPCRAIAPVFSELADTHAQDGQLAFAKVNVDHVTDVAGRYGVSAMPTFVFFEKGKPGGVKVEGLAPRGSVVLGDGGLVERVRGADRAALLAVVQALAGKKE
ncbi:thioredoxin-like protein [Echria macrotheca]|uniref:Thioredoxin-like protein n=1 Tax=Echria macrotheca TaxID=438768 RepID=A0AAJ0B3Y8_9PEZI|nr:thioredoxin-like protein [Echria macrotheca]